MSLTVVYDTETGHVLGALALTGPAGTPPPATDLVGESMPMWVTREDNGTAIELPVPAARLATALADDEPGAFVEPLDFGVVVVDGKPKPALRPLAPWDNPIVVQSDGVTVRLPGNATATDPVPVLVVVSGASGPHVRPGVISTGQNFVKVGVTLPGGVYGVLTLLAGWEGRLDVVNRS